MSDIDTRRGDELLTKFFKQYEEAEKMATESIYLTNALINKILLLIETSKLIDPAPKNTLKSELLKAMDEKKPFESVKYLCGALSKEQMVELEGIWNLEESEDSHSFASRSHAAEKLPKKIIKIIDFFNRYFYKNMSGPPVSAEIANKFASGYPHIYEVPGEEDESVKKINFIYNIDNVLSFVGLIIEKIREGEGEGEGEKKVEDYESDGGMRGGMIFRPKEIFNREKKILYASEKEGVKKELDIIKVAEILSEARKSSFTCSSIVSKLLKEGKAAEKITDDDKIKLGATLTADPCAGLTSATNPARSTNCSILKTQCGLASLKPRNTTVEKKNWGAVQTVANKFYPQMDAPGDCLEHITSPQFIVLNGRRGGVLEGGSGDVGALKSIQEEVNKRSMALPMPSFTGQVVDMAIKLLQGLERSNVKIDDTIITDISANVDKLKTAEEEVYGQMMKLKELYEVAHKIQGGEEHELNKLDDAEVKALKETLKENIRKLIKRKECMQKVIYAVINGV